MNNCPFFSVVIPLYNKEKYIKRTLNSVLNQTFTNFEIIVVDDGSIDKSCAIVESIKDQKITLIRQKNGGPSKARNRGIKEAKGKFIAFIDADDEWLPEKLEKHYRFHSKNFDVIWSSTAFKVSGGKREEHIAYSKNGIIDDAIEAIIDGISITSSTVVIKKNVFNNSQLLFNEFFKRSEDREVWYKTACLYPRTGYINEILAVIHVNTEGSLNATGLNEEDFSFLSLAKRIEKELSVLDGSKRKRFLKYLEYLIQVKMLSLWGWTYSFHKISKHFEPYVDHRLIRLLIKLDLLPLLLKKILVKIYLQIKKLINVI